MARVTGRAVDETLMRVTDLMLAFPTVILAMIISAALGAGIRNAVIAIMVAWWPTYARFARGLVSARATANTSRRHGRSARPRCACHAAHLGQHRVADCDSGHARRREGDPEVASLSFLGLGPPPQIPEWGSMIAAGRDYLDQSWIATFPGFAILTLVVALNVVGDGLHR